MRNGNLLCFGLILSLVLIIASNTAIANTFEVRISSAPPVLCNYAANFNATYCWYCTGSGYQPSNVPVIEDDYYQCPYNYTPSGGNLSDVNYAQKIGNHYAYCASENPCGLTACASGYYVCGGPAVASLSQSPDCKIARSGIYGTPVYTCIIPTNTLNTSTTTSTTTSMVTSAPTSTATSTVGTTASTTLATTTSILTSQGSMTLRVQASDLNDSYLRDWNIFYLFPGAYFGNGRFQNKSAYTTYGYSGYTFYYNHLPKNGTFYLVIGQSGGPAYGTYQGTLWIGNQSAIFSGLDVNHALKVTFDISSSPNVKSINTVPLPGATNTTPSLTISLSPISVNVLAGQSFTVTNHTSGGIKPYTFSYSYTCLGNSPCDQQYLAGIRNGNTFTFTQTGVYYINLCAASSGSPTSLCANTKVTVANTTVTSTISTTIPTTIPYAPINTIVKKNYTIELQPGWNLISPALIPFHNSTSTTCSGLLTWSYSNGNYSRAFGSYQYYEVGYWAYTAAACSLTYYGVPSVSFGLPLFKGWNLIGIPLNISPISFNSVIGSCNVVKGPYWYDPLMHAYNLSTVISPGKGYFINVADKCELYSTSTTTPPPLPG